MSVKCWCQTESCWHRGVVFVFLFFSWSLHYPQQLEYSDSSDNRNWCLQYALKDICQKREASSFQMPRDAQIFIAFPEQPCFFLFFALQKILVQILIPYPALYSPPPQKVLELSLPWSWWNSPQSTALPEECSCSFHFVQIVRADGVFHNGHAWALRSLTAPNLVVPSQIGL